MTNANDGYQSLRRHRSSVIGGVYHITCVTNNRTPLFSNLNNARNLIQIMADDHDHGSLETLAFCVMPDHLHWLFELKSGDLHTIVKRVKSKMTKATGTRVWQEGFHDHHIRTDEALIGVARYIVANPIRANLVSQIGDYPHWYAKWL
jgi:REP element-mobilizing transposase RayT